MAKTLKEIPTRSASAETKTLGAVMSLDDLGPDVRSQTVAESLERVLPAPAPAPTPIASTPPAPTPIASTPPAPTPIASTPPAPELAPAQIVASASAPLEKKVQTQMLSTPIPATMKKRLNRLRLEHSISTAFVLEAALQDFFGDRSDDEIASDLLARGGRLRRSNA